MADMYLGRRRHLEALEEMTNPTSPRRTMSSNLKKEDVFGSALKEEHASDSSEADKAEGHEPIIIPVIGDLNPRHRTFTDHSHATEEVEFK